MNLDEPQVILKNHSLQIQQGAFFAHFDRTGRFLFSVEPQRVVRRGFDHRMLEISKQKENQQMIRKYRDLTNSEKETFLASIYQLTRITLSKYPTNPVRSSLEKILHWEKADLATDRLSFEKCYQPISILPPDQYKSLVIQISEGCSYNRCLFCDFYRDRHFHIKTIQQLLDHLDHLKNFFGERLLERHGIFLGDGNALVIPTDHLLSMLQEIRRFLGTHSIQFSTFMDTFNIHKKTLQDLKSINKAGVNTVYIGFETGSDELRAILKKPGTANEALHAVHQLKASGFQLGIIILVGVGGKPFEKQHVSETIQVVEQMRLAEEDKIFLSPFVIPNNSSYFTSAKEKNLSSISTEEMDNQVKMFKKSLALKSRAKITMYSIKEHIY